MNARHALHSPGLRRGLAATAVGAAAWSWWALDSAPYPYAQRRLLDLPLPFLTQQRLESLLELRPGQRVLEIGPGTGLQSLRIAPRLGPGGRLDIVDIQQEMLDHVMLRAGRLGIDTIVPTCADAHALPFPDEVFDAAYLVTALGEIPDPKVALAELRRVVHPEGRVVVGEFFDRHQIRRSTLAHRANAAGMHVTRLLGPPFAYYALLRPCGSTHEGSPPEATETPAASFPALEAFSGRGVGTPSGAPG
ncbi:class I SAM-dependent methyltransferase [Kitasatospora sp. NPDC052896]|uniref:class I SAM-dependent methyltransferase n=1 Tax=Kitasatospora sp. NPDC052896 TaxID=3364061 RepID=UPI0037C9B1F5